MASRRGADTGAEDWFRRARQNLRIAKDNLGIRHPDAAAFYAQQAAEFALKALQIELRGRMDQIHDLTRLAKDVDAPPRIVKAAAFVTPAYTGARYPDAASKRMTRNKAEQIIDAAGRIVRWVRRQLD